MMLNLELLIPIGYISLCLIVTEALTLPPTNKIGMATAVICENIFINRGD
jgi:hypothetical protein